MKDSLTGKKVLFLFVLSLTAIFPFVIRAAATEKQKPDTREVTVTVDPRVELISIIFRLAGNPEYNRGQFISYIAAVEKQFGPYRHIGNIRLLSLQHR